MSMKKNFTIDIMDYKKFNDFKDIIVPYASKVREFSSHMFFDTQPVNESEIHTDMITFQVDGDDDFVEDTLQEMIGKFDEVESDYLLFDDETGKMIVYIPFVGAIKIRFDNLDVIKENTYKRIDELKILKTDYGYCKGFKPDFRPFEMTSIENVLVKPESIYLFAHTLEDLLKLRDHLSEEIMKIDSGLEIEFRKFSEFEQE